jgi:hypothetical protein
MTGKTKERLLNAKGFADVTISDAGFWNLWLVTAAVPA